jgi:hypothetical protein
MSTQLTKTFPLPEAGCPQVAGSPARQVEILFVFTFPDPAAITGDACGDFPCPATLSPTRATGLLLAKTFGDPFIIAPPAESAPLFLAIPGIIM